MAVMMQPREKWTDERLDDLDERMDKGFAETKAEIADTKTEMRAGFARVDADIRGLRGELSAMNRNMIAGFFVVVGAIIGSNAALIASNAFF
ncbi:MAG TPA: hypothetical protein VFU11_13245 [Solirubrobacterales bacterium]|nr:hypothetical protein [Solirubrobacterales bacterium]